MGIKTKVFNWLAGKPTSPSKNDVGYSMSFGNTFDMDYYNGITFTVYNANGGKVIEFSKTDSATGQSRNGLHIITDKENFQEALSQIITIETLKGN